MGARIKDAGILEGAVYEVFQKYRERIRDRGLPFSLPIVRFRELIFSNCHYCGGTPGEGIKTPYMGNIWYFMRNTVDRIDSQKGYTPENSVPCCLICNMDKGAKNVYDWLQWIHAVAAHTKDYPGLKEAPPFSRRHAIGKIQMHQGQLDYLKYLAYNRSGGA